MGQNLQWAMMALIIEIVLGMYGMQYTLKIYFTY